MQSLLWVMVANVFVSFKSQRKILKKWKILFNKVLRVKEKYKKMKKLFNTAQCEIESNVETSQNSSQMRNSH